MFNVWLPSTRRQASSPTGRCSRVSVQVTLTDLPYNSFGGAASEACVSCSPNKIAPTSLNILELPWLVRGVTDNNGRAERGSVYRYQTMDGLIARSRLQHSRPLATKCTELRHSAVRGVCFGIKGRHWPEPVCTHFRTVPRQIWTAGRPVRVSWLTRPKMYRRHFLLHREKLRHSND